MKYEKPEIIDFKWAEAMGVCDANGSGDATSCHYNGNNALAICDSDGNTPGTACNSDGNAHV